MRMTLQDKYLNICKKEEELTKELNNLQINLFILQPKIANLTKEIKNLNFQKAELEKFTLNERLNTKDEESEENEENEENGENGEKPED